MVLGRVRRAGWHRVGFGLHRRDTDIDGTWCDLVAWSQVLPSSGCLTHLTGAALHGLWLPPLPVGLPVFVSVAKEQTRPKRPELRVIRHSKPVDRTTRRGLPVASVEETLLACARDLGLLDLVVLGDSALRAGLTTPAELLACASRRRWGANALTRAVAWMDGRSESPWESVLRVFHRICGIPVVPRHVVTDGAGRFVARGDLWVVGSRDAARVRRGRTPRTSAGTGPCSRPAGTAGGTPGSTCCTGRRRSSARPTRLRADGTAWTGSTRGSTSSPSRCSTLWDGNGSPYASVCPQVAHPDTRTPPEPVGIGHNQPRTARSATTRARESAAALARCA